MADHHDGSGDGWRVSVQCMVREAELPECAFPSWSSGTSETQKDLLETVPNAARLCYGD